MDNDNLLELLHQLDHLDDTQHDGAAVIVNYDGAEYYLVDIDIDNDPDPDNRAAHFHHDDHGSAYVHAHDHHRVKHHHLDLNRPDLDGAALFERATYERATHSVDGDYHAAPAPGGNPWSAFYRVGN